MSKAGHLGCFYAIDASHAGGHLHLAEHLGLAADAHRLMVAANDTRLEPKLVEESFFGLPKGVKADDSALCNSVGESLAWVDFKERESSSALFASVTKVDHLIHVQSLRQCATESLRFVTIVVTSILLVPATRLPVTRTPTTRLPVTRTPTTRLPVTESRSSPTWCLLQASSQLTP